MTDEALICELNGVIASTSSAIDTCYGGCSSIPTGAVAGNLDKVAGELSALMNRAACILGMSIKPTYTLVALAVLIVHRQWRALLVSSGLISVVGLASAIILPMDVWPEWWYQLKFHGDPVDARYLSPGTLQGYTQSAVLRNVIALFLPEQFAHRAASILFVAFTTGTVLWGIIGDKSKATKYCFLIFSIFFLAIPYLGFHDELLLFPLLVSKWPMSSRTHSFRQVLLLASIGTLCYMPLSPLLRVILKLLVIGQLYRFDLPTDKPLFGNCGSENDPCSK